MWPQLSVEKMANFEPLWPLFWLQGVSVERQVHALALMMSLALVFGMTAILRPWSFAARFGLGVVFFILCAWWNSFGRFNHSMLGWPVCVLILSFLREPLSSQRIDHNRQVIWAAVSVVMSFYVLAGWTKAVDFWTLWQQGPESGFELLIRTLPRILKWALIQRETIWMPPSFLIEPGWLSALAFVAVLVFELGAFVPIVFPALMGPWLICAVIFHLSTAAWIGVSFKPMIFLHVCLWLLQRR